MTHWLKTEEHKGRGLTCHRHISLQARTARRCRPADSAFLATCQLAAHYPASSQVCRRERSQRDLPPWVAPEGCALSVAPYQHKQSLRNILGKQGWG